MTQQYIITDPCYILPDVTWDRICNECENEDYYNGKFDNLVTQALNEIAGTTNAKASSTGFGDWSNSMHSSDDNKIMQSDFYADSGMVCVVEYTKKFQSKETNELIERGGAALIKTEGDVKIKMNTDDPNWTVVEIDDDTDSFNSCLPFSEDTDNEEEEDDD